MLAVLHYRFRRNRKNVLLGILIMILVYLVFSQGLSTYQKGDNQEEDMKLQLFPDSDIPMVIHRQWDSNQIPLEASRFMQSWMRHKPELQTWFWMDSDSRNFVIDNVSQISDFIYNDWNIFTEGKMSEVLRYVILYKYGGIFAELDVEFLKPLDEKVLQHPCIIAQEPTVNSYLLNDHKALDRAIDSNVIIICRPKHPFLKFVIQKILVEINHEGTQSRHYNNDKWCFDNLVQEYRKLLNLSSNTDGLRPNDLIYLAPPQYFMPTWKSNLTSRIRKVCESILSSATYSNHRTQIRYGICYMLDKNGYLNIPLAESYTNHH